MATRTQPVADPELFGGAEPAPVETVTLGKAELETLIAAQVAAAMAGVQSGGQVSGANAFKDVLDQMALSIAEMSHQSNRTHKPVDPKVLAARAAGFDKLYSVLARIARDRKDVEEQEWASESEKTAALMSATPRYRLISAVVLGEELIMPVRPNPATKMSEPIAIYWSHEPNDAMIPLNDVAKEVHAAFRESRGTRTDIERRAIKPAWTTENGLYIEGRAPKRRELDKPGVLRDTVEMAPEPTGKAYINVMGGRPFELMPRPIASKLEGVR